MFPKDCKFRTGMKEGNVWCFYCQIKIYTYFNSSSTFWFHKIWPNSTVTKTSKNFAKTVFSPSGPPRVFEFPESPIIAVCPISNDGDTVLKCRKLWTRDKKSKKICEETSLIWCTTYLLQWTGIAFLQSLRQV